jgi:hypothetical protein
MKYISFDAHKHYTLASVERPEALVIFTAVTVNSLT